PRRRGHPGRSRHGGVVTASVLGNAPPSTGGGSARTKVVIAVFVVVAVALAGAAIWGLSRIGGGTGAATTVDRSRDPNGMAALLILLESFDATVERGDVARLHDRTLEPVDV